MSKNTVDIANALLAEKAALEARVKELEAKLAAGKSARAVLPNPKKWQDVEGELTDFGKAVFAGGYNQAIADAIALGCQPQVVPDGWEACSPEWIERNGSCSCAEAPRIAFGNTGPHYHPAVFASGQQQRFVVKMPQRYVCEGYHIDEAYLAPDAEGDCLEYDDVVEAIKAAGGEIEE